MKQAGEEVNDRQVKAGGSQDVVGFSTMDNGAGLIKNQRRHQQHDTSRKRQMQTGDVKSKERRSEQYQHGDDHYHHAHHDKTLQEAEVFTGGECISRKAKEDQGCTAKCLQHDGAAVSKGQIMIQKRSKTCS